MTCCAWPPYTENCRRYSSLDPGRAEATQEPLEPLGGEPGIVGAEEDYVHVSEDSFKWDSPTSELGHIEVANRGSTCP